MKPTTCVSVRCSRPNSFAMATHGGMNKLTEGRSVVCFFFFIFSVDRSFFKP